MNLYNIEITISQIDGYNSGYGSYSKKANVVALNEDLAREKVEKLLKQEIKDIIKNKSYCVAYQSNLLLENVII